MERTTYRRRSAKKDVKEKNLKNSILNQTISSGIILSVVILICSVKTEQTNTIRIQLKNVLNKTTNIEEIKKNTGYFNEKYISIKNSVNTIFDNTTEGEENGLKIDNQKIKNESDRIDEDVLEELKSSNEDNNEKKSVVPE